MVQLLVHASKGQTLSPQLPPGQPGCPRVTRRQRDVTRHGLERPAASSRDTGTGWPPERARAGAVAAAAGLWPAEGTL